MKFLMTYQSSNKAPPTPEHMAAIAQFTERMMKSGVLVLTGGLQRPAKDTHVRMQNGAFSVTDGPFAESKELIDGFALVEAKSREHALELCKSFMEVAGDGEGEVLQVFEGGPSAP